MFPVQLSATVALVVTFGVAVVGKLRTSAAFREFAAALAQFGVPPPARVAVAVAVVVAELAVLVALVAPGPSPLVRLGPALVLLVLLTSVVAVAGRGGKRVACHCFGSANADTVGPHVVVNVVLIAVGVGGVVAAGPVGDTGAAVLAIGLGALIGIAAVVAVPVLEAIGPIGARVSAPVREEGRP